MSVKKGHTLFYRHVPPHKYELTRVREFQTPFRPETAIETPHVSLGTDGLLTLYPGFRWDGPSGPTVDSPNSLRASALHDAVYGLMAAGLLSRSAASRKKADDDFHAELLKAGMHPVRAAAWHRAVRVKGRDSASPKSLRPYEIERSAP